MYPQGVCRIRKPAYAGNGCAIFLVFQTEDVGQKDGCGSQTQLRGVALHIFALFCPNQHCPRSGLTGGDCSFDYRTAGVHSGPELPEEPESPEPPVEAG